MFKRRLIILVLLAVARFGGWTGVRCCVPGTVQRWALRAGFWGIGLLLFRCLA